MKRETPLDPHRLGVEQIVDKLLDEGYPFVVVIGFEEEPKNLYAEIERLGGVELLMRQSMGDTLFFKTGSRWLRFLFRLELAWHRFVRRRRKETGLVTRIPDGPAD